MTRLGFAGLREVNVWLEQRCRELWDEIHHPEQPQHGRRGLER